MALNPSYSGVLIVDAPKPQPKTNTQATTEDTKESKSKKQNITAEVAEKSRGAGN